MSKSAATFSSRDLYLDLLIIWGVSGNSYGQSSQCEVTVVKGLAPGYGSTSITKTFTIKRGGSSESSAQATLTVSCKSYQGSSSGYGTYVELTDNGASAALMYVYQITS